MLWESLELRFPPRNMLLVMSVLLLGQSGCLCRSLAPGADDLGFCYTKNAF
ncbi:hypothetical protein M758_9G001000 [Ceratodon purpureus]|uniref:Uncharacterized protein n=1 Tax=Ceratodon purpureus TaxID=3225 RepID=A0A8T0GNN2_CERPU|nr:hypothetical protein KC19_9G001100 [Ceratodon purpureus]KAG0604696.1 hypothetical protein M758_9G001000 [Ceratodon purpureus]